MLLHVYYRRLFETFIIDLQVYAESGVRVKDKYSVDKEVAICHHIPLIVIDFFHREYTGADSTMADRVNYALSYDHPYEGDLMYCSKCNRVKVASYLIRN